jgi:hypothetical protein
MFQISKSRLILAALSLACVAAWSIAPSTSLAQGQKTQTAKTTMHQAADKAKMSGPLDGKRFAGQVGTEGKTEGSKELVGFKGGLFTSSYCVAQGFKAAPYMAETKDGVTTFHSEQTDPAKGKLVWDGTIKGDTLTATGSLTPEGKEATKFWIKGSTARMEHAMHMPSKKK